MSDPQKIGEIKQEFKPAIENLVAGVILGCLAAGGGMVLVYFVFREAMALNWQMPVNAEKGMSWFAFGMGLVFSLGLIVGGIVLFVWMRSLMRLKVILGTKGFAISDRKGQRAYRWEEIQSVNEFHVYEKAPLKGPAKHLLPQKKSFRYVIKGKDGSEFQFDGNSLRGHVEFAKELKPQMERRNTPWIVKRE